MSNIVSTKELKQGFGVKQIPSLVRTLNECKIKYWLVDGKPVTTKSALDKALLDESKEPRL
jgi:hypothetical protein